MEIDIFSKNSEKIRSAGGIFVWQNLLKSAGARGADGVGGARSVTRTEESNAAGLTRDKHN